MIPIQLPLGRGREHVEPSVMLPPTSQGILQHLTLHLADADELCIRLEIWLIIVHFILEKAETHFVVICFPVEALGNDA